jgi:hypothetical protein
MCDNIIIYEDGMTVKVWTEPDQGKDFAEVLTAFYEKCGGKITPEMFGKAIAYMSPADASSLFNQLVNDVVLKKVYLGCYATELEEKNNAEN